MAMGAPHVIAALRRTRAILQEGLGLKLTWPPGATPAEISSAERESGITLDEEARTLFVTMNGRLRSPCFIVHEFLPCHLVPLARAPEYRANTIIPWDHPFHFGGRLVEPDPRVLRCLAHPGWFPLAEFNGGSTLVLYDSTPSPAGRIGQIIAYEHDPDAVYWVAASVAEFIDTSNRHIEARGREVILGEAPAPVPPRRHSGPTRTDRCVCAEYVAPPRTLDALWERVTYTPAVKASLELLAHHEQHDLNLYRCVVCGALWQGSGGENPGHAYVQHIPATGIEAWLQEPFQEAWHVYLHTPVNEAWIRNQETGTGTCRVTGCSRPRVRFSLECHEHELAEAQERWAAGKPPGRPWPA
jgi:cell wall assembly regulator SMI1